MFVHTRHFLHKTHFIHIHFVIYILFDIVFLNVFFLSRDGCVIELIFFADGRMCMFT